MRSAKSVLVLVGVSALAANVAVGCSGDDGRVGYVEADDGGPRASLPPSSDPDKKTPPAPTSTTDPNPPQPGADSGGGYESGDAADDGSIDTIPDASIPDAAVIEPETDAGAPGSVCPTKDLVQQQRCGLCGVQYRLCAPDDSSYPEAPPVWQPWGFCQNEVKDGCDPGTAATEGCGLCGTRNKVCQNDCRWAVGACKNEPPNACAPGTEDYQIGLSCGVGGRMRTCQESCMYGPFGECFVPGEPTLTLAGTAGAKVHGQFKLEATSTIARLGGTCPNGTTNNTVTPYQYVVLVNPTSSTIVASVWSAQSTRAGAGYIDTVLAAYQGDAKPTNDAQRAACIKGAIDTCSSSDANDPAACVSSWGGLVGGNAITIPPDGKALIYVGGWSTSSLGDYQLTARTDSIN